MSKRYFVTGATGVVGSALVPLLLEDPNSRIWILMRASDAKHLDQRFQELIAFWDLDPEQAADARRRITPLLGDTDHRHFGLAESCYFGVARQCTHIIHCAGVVRMNLPLELARQHALGSARNVVELAIACQQFGGGPKVEFVSTVGVAGRLNGLIPETWITQAREFHNTYEQSKAEAEVYLREQIDLHRLSVTVHRPSMVVGDSQTGKIIHFQIFYYLCEFISGRQTFGILPSFGDAGLDTVPVDYVASVLKWSADQGEATAGRIFHLSSGADAIPLRELRSLVLERFSSQQVKIRSGINLPSVFFTAILAGIVPVLPDRLRRRVKAVPVFIDYLRDRLIFDNAQTLSFLAAHSGPTLLSTNQYIRTVVNAYVRTKYG